MRSSSDLRLECIRLASMLATGKQIAPKDVIPTAMEYMRWIEQHNEEATPETIRRLATKFNAR